MLTIPVETRCCVAAVSRSGSFPLTVALSRPVFELLSENCPFLGLPCLHAPSLHTSSGFCPGFKRHVFRLGVRHVRGGRELSRSLSLRLPARLGPGETASPARPSVRLDCCLCACPSWRRGGLPPHALSPVGCL